MPNDRTLEQIQREGLIALRERLGVEGMVRFLQQFENGSGDYATERRKWVKKNSLGDIRAMIRKPRTRKPPKARKAG
jgi:hypothetical protein